MPDEHEDEHAELRAREQGPVEVLAEQVGAVDDDEPAETPRILGGEAELSVLDDDPGLIVDPPEAREAIREVLVFAERVSAHVLVEADLRRRLATRAHEAAAHELDVTGLLDPRSRYRG